MDSISQTLNKFSKLALISNLDSNQKEILETKYKIFNYYYKQLLWINKEINNNKNILNDDLSDTDYGKICKEIRQHKNIRNRIINIIDSITENKIYEQNKTHVKIKINNKDTFYCKLSEINYLCLNYDTVSFDTDFNSTIQQIYSTSNILYDNLSENYEIIELENYTIDESLKDIFSFEPLVYIAGGLFGDFIHQLSIINENFLKTGRKGDLYIYDKVGHFTFGTKYTYDSTYNVIKNQKYINKYEILENLDTISYDVNLSIWHKSPLNCRTNFYNIFKDTYNVEWGKNQWLNVPKIDGWEDIVVFSCVEYADKYPELNYIELFKNIGKKIVYVSINESEYIDFTLRSGVQIPYYKAKDFTEIATIMNSCDSYIGNPSGTLSIAFALHKNCHIIVNKYALHLILISDHQNIFPILSYII
jgi:hypothetical protein